MTKVKRVTFSIEVSQDQHIEMLAAVTGHTKSHIIRKLIDNEMSDNNELIYNFISDDGNSPEQIGRNEGN